MTSPLKKNGDPMQVDSPAKSGGEGGKETVALKKLTYESGGTVKEQELPSENNANDGGTPV